MALEKELKFVKADLDAARGRLREIGAVRRSHVFEHNVVFDTPDRQLKQQQTLLRLRQADKVTLTLKRPPEEELPEQEVPVMVKVFEEMETEVKNFTTMRRMLLSLGYYEAFAYEKVRETWTLEGASICLDTLVFGDFIEIEAEPARIHEVAIQLGLSPEQASTATYHQLNQEYLLDQGLPSNESFTFLKEERLRLQAEIAMADHADHGGP